MFWPFILGVAVLAVASGVVWLLRHRNSVKFRLNKVPVTPITKLPVQGIVHVFGVIKAPKDTLVASPYTNSLGVFSHSYMSSEMDPNKPLIAQKTVQSHEEFRHSRFEVVDDSGAITVDPKNAELGCKPHPVELVTEGKSKVFGAGLLASYNPDGNYYEAVFRVGDRVHVMGMQCEIEGKRVLASAPGTRLLLAPELADVD